MFQNVLKIFWDFGSIFVSREVPGALTKSSAARTQPKETVMSSSQPVVTEELLVALWDKAEELAKELQLGGEVTVLAHVISATVTPSIHVRCMMRLLELLSPEFKGLTEEMLLEAAKAARKEQDRLRAEHPHAHAHAA